MAATFENATEIIETDTNESIAVTVPTSLASGNMWVVFVIFDTDGAGTIATPSGFTQIGSQMNGADDGWPNCALFYKIAGASESTTNFTMSGANSFDSIAYSIRVSGSGTLSLDATGTPYNPSGTGTVIDAPDITIAQNDSLALLFAASVGTPTFGTTQTAPSGSTLVDGRNGNNVYPVAAFARETVSAGSYAPGNWTWGASATNNNNRIGQTISIKDTVAGGDPEGGLIGGKLLGGGLLLGGVLIR